MHNPVCSQETDQGWDDRGHTIHTIWNDLFNSFNPYSAHNNFAQGYLRGVKKDGGKEKIGNKIWSKINGFNTDGEIRG